MIGGLESCSFIDFPGCLSAVIFLRGCNLRCPYCQNTGLLAADHPSIMGKDEFQAFLSSRRGRLDAVVVSGGEPTLQPGLRSLIEVARALGYKIKLDTNGTRPDVLQHLLRDGFLDYIALDLKDEPAAYPTWLGMREAPEVLLRSLDLVKGSGVDHELRTTVVSPRHDAERLRRMARWALGCQRWILQPCLPVTKERFTTSSSSRAATLEELALLIRERYGIACHSRLMTTGLRGFGSVTSRHQQQAARLQEAHLSESPRSVLP